MEYINLTITQLAEAPYRRSTMPERGMWLTLLAYCVQQENGGTIEGAQSWTDYDYLQVLGIPAKDVEGEHHLWKYVDGNLVVMGYPLAQQKALDAKRKAGRKGNKVRWGSESHTSSHSDSHTDQHSESERESNSKGKGKEEGEDGPRPRSSADVRTLAAHLNVPLVEADKFFDHFEANGWKQGGRTPLRSWQAAFRNWARRAGDFGPEKNRVEGGRPGDNPNGGLQIFNDEPPGDEPPAAVAGGAR